MLFQTGLQRMIKLYSPSQQSKHVVFSHISQVSIVRQSRPSLHEYFLILKGGDLLVDWYICFMIPNVTYTTYVALVALLCFTALSASLHLATHACPLMKKRPWTVITISFIAAVTGKVVCTIPIYIDPRSFFRSSANVITLYDCFLVIIWIRILVFI